MSEANKQIIQAENVNYILRYRTCLTWAPTRPIHLFLTEPPVLTEAIMSLLLHFDNLSLAPKNWLPIAYSSSPFGSTTRQSSPASLPMTSSLALIIPLPLQDLRRSNLRLTIHVKPPAPFTIS